MKEFDNIEAMEQYLDGNLTGESLTQFENRMATDPTFANEVELFMDMRQAIINVEEKKVKKTIHKVHNQLVEDQFFAKREKKQAKQPTTLRWVMGLAAGVALLIGAALFLLRPNQPDTSAIFAQTFQPETEKIGAIIEELKDYGMIDPEAERKEALASALELYEQGNYENTKSTVTRHLEKYPNDQYAQFYLGMSQLQQKDFSAAITQLQPLSQDNNFALQTEARWNLALGQLMVKETEALQLLKTIATDNNNAFQSKAKEIIQQYE